MSAHSKMLTVEAGVAVLNTVSKEKRIETCIQLLRLQTSRCLYRGNDDSLTVTRLGSAMLLVGSWLRGVNRKGKFNLPLRKLEIAFYKELEASTKLRLFNIWGALCGKAKTRKTPDSKRATDVAAKCHQASAPECVSTSISITCGATGKQTLATGGIA